MLVLVNGMGATPLLELYVFFAEVQRDRARQGGPGGPHAGRQLRHQPRHGGLSVTLCRLDEELLRLWDAPVETPALRWGR